MVVGGTQNGALKDNHVVIGDNTAGGVRYDSITANVTNKTGGALTYPV